jgi:pimeloyl-ACP methyl ester carboxylesterase
MARFVLVHGAWHGAWCWDGVAADLRAAGHEVDAIDLPGHGEDATPADEVTLDRYAQRVAAALDAGEGPAVLVGHSMGGIAITQAAELRPDRIALLVYVCAFLPRDGESLQILAELPENAGDIVMPNAVIEPPVAIMPPDAARAAFYSRCSDADASAAVARLDPQPLAPLGTPVALTAQRAGSVPRAYIACLADAAIPIALQRRMIDASPCREVAELDSDHSPFACRRAELAAELQRLASQSY